MPGSFDDMAPILGGKENLAKLLKNPATGDDPGYEYFKPPRGQHAGKTIIIYQLRDGKRDTTLAVAYLDTSVGVPKR